MWDYRLDEWSSGGESESREEFSSFKFSQLRRIRIFVNFTKQRCDLVEDKMKFRKRVLKRD